MISKNISQIKDIEEVLENLKISTNTVLVKPNWVGAFPGGFTDAKIIDLLLTALKGKRVIFLESYTFWRTDRKINTQDDYFSSKEATLETGKQHWDFFKRMDEWFLAYTGIGDILKKHGAQYLCITDEIWKGSAANPQTIQRLVESRFGPIVSSDLYKAIPAKLLELKGKPLISLAKAKIDSSYGLSGSIKNMFGLIPDPTRFEKYHGGKDEEKLVDSIIGINKIYQSLFDVKYVVESVFNYSQMNWDTEISEKLDGNGLIIAGDSGREVDREMEKIYGVKMKGPLADLLGVYKTTFGE